MNNEITMVAPAVFELLAALREPVRGARWDEVTRVRPVSALAEIVPDLDRAMMDPNLPMTTKEANSYALTYEIAYLNITRGSASDETFNALLHGIHLSAVFARMGYGREWLPSLSLAIDSLMRAAERGQKTGSWRLDGEGIGDVREALDVLVGQLEVVPRKDFPGAIPVLEKILRELGLIG